MAILFWVERRDSSVVITLRISINVDGRWSVLAGFITVGAKGC